MALGAHDFHSAYQRFPPLWGTFPQPPTPASQQRVPDCANPPDGGTSATSGPPWGNVHFYILPFIEQDGLWNSTYDPNPDCNHSSQGYRPWLNRWKPVKTYICPSDGSIPTNGLGSGNVVGGWGDNPSLTSYASNGQVFATCDPTTGVARAWDGGARMPATFPDGTNNTIMFAERLGTCGYFNGNTGYGAGSGCTVWNWWGIDTSWATFAYFDGGGFGKVGPASIFQVQPLPFTTKCDVYRASTMHTGGIQVAMCDGSVRGVSPDVSGNTWWAACTPAGGETLGADW